MRKHLALLALPLLVAGPLVAQPAGIPGTTDAARVTAGTYVADASHTQVLWSVNHMGFSAFDGAFADATGTLTLDPARPAAASLMMTIPINRVTTTSEGLNNHLLGKDFFDVARFPTATFQSTSIGGDRTGRDITVTGNLTLRGVTRPVTLKARFVGAGSNPMNKKPTIGFRATTTIKRSAFGINYAVPAVSDDVTLTINAAFERAS